ncbi:MAG TPA: enolase C-terminal domain-like protein [Armatimonadota bacterium]|jgi:L-alanine-DL-glutamate epimerase-like enolase superfamily enzyme
MQTDIRVQEVEASFSPEEFRTPLKFGTGVVSAITGLTVRARVETRAGQVADGWGHILLSDLWSYPGNVPHELRDLAMRDLAETFCKLLAEQTDWAHPLDLYLRLKPELSRLAAEVTARRSLAEPFPLLAALVSASPADAALHDAFGRAHGISSYDGYGPDFVDHDLSVWCGPEFRGKHLSDYLRSSNQTALPIFHLVGGVDKLRRAEVTAEDPQDGLPVSLEEWIERDGLCCFKIKLRGHDIDWDVERTAEVAEVIVATYERLGQSGEFFLSTDSNETNESPATVVEYLEKLQRRSPLAYARLLYVEQPTERDLSGHRFDMREVTRHKPVIADEGITDVDKLRLARELGWSGVGLKTCKGHSASLLYMAMCTEFGMPYTLQDLTNPGLSLVHQAGLAARISTLKGFEYNARQFLPNASPELQARHESLFTVRDGHVLTESLAPVGLGYRLE